MGSCAAKTQREERIIPSITEYRGTQMQTSLKSTSCNSFRGLLFEEEYDTEYDVNSIFNQHHHILLRKEFAESSSCTIISCISIKRIIILFKYYMFLQRRYDDESCQCYCKLMQYLNTEYLDLMNDYHHIIHRHINDATRSCDENNIQFELLYNEITKYIGTCDVVDCKQFFRHKTTRNCDDCDEQDIAIRFYVDLLDAVHSFFLHSFDDGFRVKQHNNNDDIHNHNNDKHMFYDEAMSSLKAHLGDRTADIEHVLRDRMAYNKFHTNYEYRHLIKSKLSRICEGEMMNKGDIQIQMEQYCEFDYILDIDLKASATCAKYSCLKQEVLSNTIYRLTAIEYDRIMYKATKLLHSSCIIKSEFDAMTVCNIFCIVCYSDYPLFSYHFRSTFRRINANETMNELCARNAEFWSLSRILRETVLNYGCYLNDTKMPKLYTSISFALFSSFCSGFVGITSMTQQMAVITSYCLHDKHSANGLILELDPFEQENINLHPLKYFDCCLFSEFGNENEIIFCANNVLQNLQFKFSSIKIIANNEDYRCGIKAISIFMDAMNAKLSNQYPVHMTSSHYEIIETLCDENNTFPHYINQLFLNLCTAQIQVHIDLENLNIYYPRLIAIFSHSQCSNLLLFDRICNSVFTECRYIKVDQAGHVSMQYLRFLVRILKQIKTKVRTIEIRTITIDVNKFKANNMQSLFQNINWIIHIEKQHILTHLVLTKQT